MRYPDEVHKFIFENVSGKHPSELVELVNYKFGTDFTVSKMRSYMKNHSLKNGLPSMKKGHGFTYPEEVRKFLYEHYVGTGHQDMADMLNNRFGTNYTKEQIKGCYARYKLDSGLTGRFNKGHAPVNKGTHIGGWEPTQFKKGHTPVNHRPVGSERINVDGYTEIKVAEPRKWRLKHNVVWEEHNGPIPKGHCVIFGDGNSQNLDINNLILISRRELAVLNHHGLIKSDVELTKTGIIIANIKMKMSDVKKRA